MERILRSQTSGNADAAHIPQQDYCLSRGGFRSVAVLPVAARAGFWIRAALLEFLRL